MAYRTIQDIQNMFEVFNTTLHTRSIEPRVIQDAWNQQFHVPLSHTSAESFAEYYRGDTNMKGSKKTQRRRTR